MQRREFLSLAAAGTSGVALAAGAQPTPPSSPARAPVLASDTLLRHIAFGSCADQTRAQPIWDAVLAGQPDLYLFAGDNVYSSAQPWSLERLQEAYATQAKVPGFAKLRASVPHIAIWDDHDYGQNDAGADFAHKQKSKDAFLDFWQIHADDARRTRDGLYHAQVIGPPGQRVQIIVPDVRWYRSAWKLTDQRGAEGRERYVPDEDPKKTMLGETQWQWLEEQLRQPAEVRLLVSSIQVVAEGHGWERWGNLPLERARLYRLIETTRAQGVVLLSGDRHIGALYRQTTGVPYPMVEVTASGITHPWETAAEAGPNRLGALYTQRHYGSVDIDWAARSLRLALRDSDGAVQRSQHIGFDELKGKTT